MRFLSGPTRLFAADPGYYSVYHPRFDIDPQPPEGPGRVEVFGRPTQSSTLRYYHALENPTGKEHSGFGYSLADRNGFLIVGAPFTTVFGVPNAGAAFVYEWNRDFFNIEYNLVASFTPPVLIANGYFGYAVAHDGESIAVGWPGVNGGKGRVTIYDQKSSDDWFLAQTLDPEDIGFAEDITPRWFGGAIAAPVNTEGVLAVAAPDSIDETFVSPRGVVAVLTRDVFKNDPYTLQHLIRQPKILGGQRYGEGLAFASSGAARLLAVGSGNRELGGGIVNLYTGSIFDSEWEHTASLRNINGGSVAAIAFNSGQRVIGSGNLGSASRLYSRDVMCFPDLRGDANGDGVTNFEDLNLVLTDFGLEGENIPGDINNDGVVDFVDLNVVLVLYGSPCIPPN
jgi:hypothetical protein